MQCLLVRIIHSYKMQGAHFLFLVLLHSMSISKIYPSKCYQMPEAYWCYSLFSAELCEVREYCEIFWGSNKTNTMLRPIHYIQSYSKFVYPGIEEPTKSKVIPNNSSRQFILHQSPERTLQFHNWDYSQFFELSDDEKAKDITDISANKTSETLDEIIKHDIEKARQISSSSSGFKSWPEFKMEYERPPIVSFREMIASLCSTRTDEEQCEDRLVDSYCKLLDVCDEPISVDPFSMAGSSTTSTIMLPIEKVSPETATP